MRSRCWGPKRPAHDQQALLDQQRRDSLETPSYTALARREIESQDLGGVEALTNLV